MKKSDKFYMAVLALLLGFGIYIFLIFPKAQADACIFAGNGVKCLKDQLQFSPSMNRYITGDTDDPSAVAKGGIAGDVYVRFGTAEMYIKTDSGSTTNWVAVGGAGGSGDVTGPGTTTPMFTQPLAYFVGDTVNQIAYDQSVQFSTGGTISLGQNGSSTGKLILFANAGGTTTLTAADPNNGYDLTLPAAGPAATQILQSDSGGNFSWINTPSGGGSGDVTGPASSVTGNASMFADTTGKLISDSGMPIGSIVYSLSDPTANNFIPITTGANTDRSVGYTDYEIPPTVGTDTQILKLSSGNLIWAADDGGGGGASALDDLTDVTLVTPTDGQLLTYEASTTQWKNATPAGAVGSVVYSTAAPPSGGTFEQSNYEHTYTLDNQNGSGYVNYPNSGANQGKSVLYYWDLTETDPGVYDVYVYLGPDPGGGNNSRSTDLTDAIDADPAITWTGSGSNGFTTTIVQTVVGDITDGEVYNAQGAEPFTASSVDGTDNFIFNTNKIALFDGTTLGKSGNSVYNSDYTLPKAVGIDGQILVVNGAATGLEFAYGVTGPASSVTGNVSQFQDTTGNIIGDSGLPVGAIVYALSDPTANNFIPITAGANTNRSVGWTDYEIPPLVGTENQILKLASGNLIWAADSTGGGSIPPDSGEAGKVLLSDGTDNPAWLADGTAGQVLTVKGTGGAGWESPSAGGGASTPAVPLAYNGIQNQGFEDGTVDGWTLFAGGTLTNQTNPIVGGYSAIFTPAAATDLIYFTGPSGDYYTAGKDCSFEITHSFQGADGDYTYSLVDSGDPFGTIYGAVELKASAAGDTQSQTQRGQMKCPAFGVVMLTAVTANVAGGSFIVIDEVWSGMIPNSGNTEGFFETLTQTGNLFLTSNKTASYASTFTTSRGAIVGPVLVAGTAGDDWKWLVEQNGTLSGSYRIASCPDPNTGTPLSVNVQGTLDATTLILGEDSRTPTASVASKMTVSFANVPVSKGDFIFASYNGVCNSGDSTGQWTFSWRN